MNDIFMHNFTGAGFGPYGPALGLGVAAFGIFILIAAVWSLVWKGFALWYAARGGEKIWFVALLLINTLGILEILYIFVFRKGRWGALSAKMKTSSSPKEKENGDLPTAESSPAE